MSRHQASDEDFIHGIDKFTLRSRSLDTKWQKSNHVPRCIEKTSRHPHGIIPVNFGFRVQMGLRLRLERNFERDGESVTNSRVYAGFRNGFNPELSLGARLKLRSQIGAGFRNNQLKFNCDISSISFE